MARALKWDFDPRIRRRLIPSLIVASTIFAFLAGNSFDNGFDCQIDREIRDRFGSRQYQVGLEVNELTYQAEVFAELAAHETDIDQQRHFATLSTMYVNLSSFRLASLTGETDAALWRVPTDSEDALTIYALKLPMRVDRISKQQIRRITKFFDEEIPSDLNKYDRCRSDEAWSFFMAFLAAVSAIFAAVISYGREKDHD